MVGCVGSDQSGPHFIPWSAVTVRMFGETGRHALTLTLILTLTYVFDLTALYTLGLVVRFHPHLSGLQSADYPLAGPQSAIYS